LDAGVPAPHGIGKGHDESTGSRPLPFHGVIFKGMANRITAATASMADDDPALP
jgi:hypothetical protein